MSDRNTDGENPYAEPKSPLEGPARKTGFRMTQGVVIITVCTVLMFSIGRARYMARMTRARAAAQKAADAYARKKALVNGPVSGTRPAGRARR